MKATLIVLASLFLLSGIFVHYPVLLYSSYLISFILTIVLIYYRRDFEITPKQSGLYCGFNTVLSIVLFQFIMTTWNKPFYFYLKLQRYGYDTSYANLVEDICFFTAIVVGFSNIWLGIRLNRLIKEAPDRNRGNDSLNLF
jgi:hypothetical protein